jgi:pyridoxamine 5'-phosphate oxidase
MLNTKEEIIDFIGKNLLAFFATTENDQPRTRGIMIYKTDDKGIIFSTGKNKDFYKQLTANPKVELCFYGDNTQVRVTGTAINIDYDMALKQELVSARPFLQPWIEAAGYEVMGLFRVCNCKATVWTMETAMARKRYVDLFE